MHKLPEIRTSGTLGASSLWADALTAWLYNLRSWNTRKSYQAAVLGFLAEVNKSPEDVTQTDVIRWRAGLERRALSPASINARLSALSSFYAFALARGLRQDNPCAGVGRFTITPYGRAVYLDTRADEDKRLLGAFNRDSLTGTRDYAACLLMLCTGLRVGSVLGARLGDLSQIDGGGAYLTVTLKGGGLGRVFVPSVALDALRAYLALRLDAGDAQAPLFASTEHGAGGARPLSAVRFGRSLAAAARRAGLRHVSPHALRHTAAMAAIRSGAPVTAVSALLKHKSMRVTTVYIQHVDTGEADEVSLTLAGRYTEN